MLIKNQHHPPGTQENHNNFPSRNLIMEKGKESEFPEGRGGGKGSGIREADSDDRGFPLLQTKRGKFSLFFHRFMHSKKLEAIYINFRVFLCQAIKYFIKDPNYIFEFKSNVK